jgi:hypothetical protein
MPRQNRRAHSPRVHCRSFLSSFLVPPASLSIVKGWRRFLRSRTLGRHFRPTLSAAEPDEREKGTRRPRIPGSKPGDRGPGRKTGDRSDVRQEYVRLKELDPAQAFGQRTGASPSCLKSISQPLPLNPIPSVRPCDADAAALVGRVESAFHPAKVHYSQVSVLCK